MWPVTTLSLTGMPAGMVIEKCGPIVSVGKITNMCKLNFPTESLERISNRTLLKAAILGVQNFYPGANHLISGDGPYISRNQHSVVFLGGQGN